MHASDVDISDERVPTMPAQPLLNKLRQSIQVSVDICAINHVNVTLWAEIIYYPCYGQSKNANKCVHESVKIRR